MIKKLLQDLYDNKILESEFGSIIRRDILQDESIEFILEIFNKGLLNDYLGLK